METTAYVLTKNSLRMIFRDRLMHVVLVVALLLMVLVPVWSSFSMRQVQEVAVTLCLSTISLVLLVLALLLGSTSVFTDIQRRFIASVLTLPISRRDYLLSKFFGISLFLLLAGGVLTVAAACVLPIAAAQYPSELPLAWGTIIISISADVLKSILLAALAVLLSSLSTSFYLPFFVTLTIYFAGSSSQEVFEFVTGSFGQEMGPVALALIKGAYYLLPNFSAFNFKVQAVYNLPVTGQEVLLVGVYALTYTGVILGLAAYVLKRRQFP